MEKLLTSSQVNDYATNGFTSGIQVINEEELTWCNSEIERFEAETGKPFDFPHKSKPHHLFEWADYLVHHPKILDALAAANDGYAFGYGNDSLTRRACDQIREVFEAPDARNHRNPLKTNMH